MLLFGEGEKGEDSPETARSAVYVVFSILDFFHEFMREKTSQNLVHD